MVHVASWTGRTVHPLMQFQRVAGLPEGPHVNEPDPPWGSHPTVGSIPEAECRTLVETLKGFTTTPNSCYFCLWDGWGNIDTRLYKAGSRVRAPHRDHLLFRGPIDAIMAFFATDWPRGNVWGNSPNIWWPEDQAWCVATDIDLCHTYIGGSPECIEAILSNPDLEALPTDPRCVNVPEQRHHQRTGDIPGRQRASSSCLSPVTTTVHRDGAGGNVEANIDA